MKLGLTLLICGVLSGMAQTNSSFPAVVTVNGSVFVALKGGQNLKLALAPVYVMSDARFTEISKRVAPIIDQSVRDAAAKYFKAELIKDTETMSKVFDSLKDFQESIYFEDFPEPETKSDADGKFTLTFFDAEQKIVACKSKRLNLDGEQENFYWALKFRPTGAARQIMFSNDNLRNDFNILTSSSVSFFEEIDRLKKERTMRIKEAVTRQTEQQHAIQTAKTSAAQLKALEYNQRQAEKGDAYGQYRMGMRYLKGEAVEVNEVVGINWLRKAAAQGHSDAKRELEKR